MDSVTGEKQLHGVLPVDPLRQSYRPDDGGEPEADLGEAEFRPLAGDDEVAPGDQGEPVAQAIAVDGGDDRLVDLPSALERVDRGLLPERPGEFARGPGTVPHVASGAERRARSGDDGHPRLLVFSKSGEGPIQRTAHLRIDGVER